MAFAFTAVHEIMRESSGLSEDSLVYAAGLDYGRRRTLANVSTALLDKGQVNHPTWAHVEKHVLHLNSGWNQLRKLDWRRAYFVKSPALFDDLAAAVNGGKPAILGVRPTDDFLAPGEGAVIGAGREIMVRHAVAVVGLHRDNEHLLIRNSWGPSWGNNGHAYLSRAFVRAHAQEAYVAGNIVD
ncbi:C1 family peptidase [Dietzia sp. MNB45]|uniref:C1 family peptidase n=1 Tax=Dietzia sp. MNB45 TaxID=3238800 RepID=UPI003F7E361C